MNIFNNLIKLQSFIMTVFSYGIFTGFLLALSSGFTEYKKFQSETQVFPEKSNNSSLSENRRPLYKEDALQLQ